MLALWDQDNWIGLFSMASTRMHAEYTRIIGPKGKQKDKEEGDGEGEAER